MKRILIVEDDRHLIQLLNLLLQVEGYETLTAETVQQGMECVERDSPDLVILDLALGAEDGRDVFRQAHASGHDIPFLILSAYGAKAAAEELKAEGWVEKPFDPEALVREVSRLVNAGPRAGK